MRAKQETKRKKFAQQNKIEEEDFELEKAKSPVARKSRKSIILNPTVRPVNMPEEDDKDSIEESLESEESESDDLNRLDGDFHSSKSGSFDQNFEEGEDPQQKSEMDSIRTEYFGDGVGQDFSNRSPSIYNKSNNSFKDNSNLDIFTNEQKKASTSFKKKISKLTNDIKKS
jgi:hypothetical protein